MSRKIVQNPSEDLIAQLDEDLRRLRQIPGYRKSSQHLPAREPGLVDDFYDFDTQVQFPGGVSLVAARYEASISRYRRTHDVGYLAFIDKDRGLTTGVILIAGTLSERTGLPFTIVYPDKEIVQDRVKWHGISDAEPAGDFDDERGVLLTDHVSSGDEVKRACNALCARGGSVGLILAYSSYPDKVEQLLRPYFMEKGIEFEAFVRCPQTDLDRRGY